MPYMDPPPGFEPGHTAKKMLLYVNKQEKAPLHGLVQDTYSDIATSFFILAIVLELVGLWFILVEIPSFWYGLLGAGALFLLDILFALWYHQKTKTICICKNSCSVLTLIFTDPILRNAAEANYQAEMRRSKRIAFIPALLIVAIAVVKIVTFYMLVSRSARIPETMVFFIITSYAIVAFVHLRYTGYACFHGLAYGCWNRDERKFNKKPTGALQAKLWHEHFCTRELLTPSSAGNPKLEEVARVDLLRRRVLLGESVKDDFQTYLSTTGNEVADTLTVEINEKEEAVLHDDLRGFLTNERRIDSSLVTKLTDDEGLYCLEANGLALDAKLSELADKSNTPEAKNIIALRGLKLQMDSLGILPAAHA